MKITDGAFPIYQIIPGVYQRGRIHHYNEQIKLTGLQALNIRDVVALAPTTADPGLQMLDDLGVIRYHHLPIPDGQLRRIQMCGGYEFTQEVLLRLAKNLADRVAAGTSVLTMCNAGRNRSGLLNALIVRERLGITGIRALEVVRRERPNALANEHFCRFLVSLPAPDS